MSAKHLHFRVVARSRFFDSQLKMTLRYAGEVRRLLLSDLEEK